MKKKNIFFGETKKIHQRCPVCGCVNSDLFINKGQYKYFKCPNCELIYLINPPTKRQLDKFYGWESPLSEEINNLNPALSTFLKISAVGYLISMWTRIIIFLRTKSIKRQIGKRRILDIGCGPGDFLQKMEQMGWDASGTEVGKNLVREAANKLKNGKIYLGLPDFRSFGQKFNVITMWHVLEHITNLGKSLSFISANLNKNGVLIIEVPHSKSVNLRFFRDQWTLLLSPEHLHFWSVKSLGILLNKYNLEIKVSEYPSHFPFIFFSSLIKSNKKFLILTPLMLLLSVFISIISSLFKMNDIVRVYAVFAKKDLNDKEIGIND